MAIAASFSTLRYALDSLSPNPRREENRNRLKDCNQASGKKDRGLEENEPLSIQRENPIGVRKACSFGRQAHLKRNAGVPQRERVY